MQGQIITRRITGSDAMEILPFRVRFDVTFLFIDTRNSYKRAR